MQIILTKEEYDELVKKSTAAELIAEEKFEELKRHLKDQVCEHISHIGGRGQLSREDMALAAMDFIRQRL